MQLELRQCKDEEKRRELQGRLKEYDEVSINVIMYRPSVSRSILGALPGLKNPENGRVQLLRMCKMQLARLHCAQ